MGSDQRVEKKVPDWNVTSFSLVSHNRFVYDGFNLITELNVNVNTDTVSLKRSFIWGLEGTVYKIMIMQRLISSQTISEILKFERLPPVKATDLIKGPPDIKIDND